VVPRSRQSSHRALTRRIAGYRGDPSSLDQEVLHRPVGTQTSEPTKGGRAVVLLRREIGDVLRDARQRQGRTLREVSSAARVSLGYLSEVERGQKEASSELRSSICGALDVPMSVVLRQVSDRVAVAEGVTIPDTVPPELSEGLVGIGA
jgi:hypothetical protein